MSLIISEKSYQFFQNYAMILKLYNRVYTPCVTISRTLRLGVRQFSENASTIRTIKDVDLADFPPEKIRNFRKSISSNYKEIFYLILHGYI